MKPRRDSGRAKLVLICLLAALAALGFFSLAPAFPANPALPGLPPGAASTPLVDKGKDFASTVLGDLFAVLGFFNVGTGTALGIIQFFAAFTLVYFVITQMNPGNSQLTAFIGTLFAVGGVGIFVKLDWYSFLIHFAPAALAFLIVFDAMSFIGVISQRTAKWIAFMSMSLVFWTDYVYFENGIFGHFFNRIFGQTYAYLANPVTIIVAAIFLTLARMFVVMSSSMRSEAAREAQLAFEKAAGHLQSEMMKGSLSTRPPSGYFSGKT